MAISSDDRGSHPQTRRQRRTIPLYLLFALLLAGQAAGFTEWTPRFPSQPQLPQQPISQRTSELAKGKLLVADRNLLDPNFAETVVLLIDYTADGAMGVIINRPTTVALSELFPDSKALQRRSERVYIGGPVGRTQLLLLVQSPHHHEGAHKIFGDVYASGSRALLQQLAAETTPGERFRAYIGYAGWAPGQLDQEVTRGDWHILPATAALIFDTPPEAVWPELIRQGTVEWAKAPTAAEER
ncbi:MAG: YqgE/AlgH family protein [Candidatus Binatia bacterium]|nr:YqgE/AlgH family protein [Candidatus Binatia bacterium]